MQVALKHFAEAPSAQRSVTMNDDVKRSYGKGIRGRNGVMDATLHCTEPSVKKLSFEVAVVLNFPDTLVLAISNNRAGYFQQEYLMQRYNGLRKLVTWNPEDLMRMIIMFPGNSTEHQRTHLKNLFITLDCPDMTEMTHIIASC